MNVLRIFLTIFTVLVFAGSAQAEIKAGFADRDISPDIGMERPGGYGKGFHQKFHDPCKARAAVFDDGKKVVALVGLDALFIRRPQVEAVRKAVQEKTGIAPEAVLIGASHSHSSGPTGMVLPGEFDHADARVQELAYEESSMADPVYLERVVKGMVDAIVESYEKREAVTLGFGSGEEGTVSFNRRWRMKNGLSFTHPRYGNPDMVEPAGPIDPEVGVIGAWNADGKLLGTVINFACHATTSPAGISANYPWFLEHVVDGTFGEDTVVVFLNGASGDVTQVDNADPNRRQTGEASAMLLGGRVGAEAVKVLLDLPRAAEATIDFKNEVMKIDRRHPSPERVAESKRLTAEKPSEPKALNDYIWAKEIVMLDAIIAAAPKQTVEVQTIQIGPAVFITDPAEYFTQYGLDQKQASKFPFTYPVSLANGCVGYVPTEEALGPNGGGYETRLTSYSNLIPTAGSIIRDKGIELANEFEPDEVPAHAPNPPFTAGWQYGNVPPELE